MSFESGSISLSVFKALPGSSLPDDAIAKLAAHALPSIETLSSEECVGWSTGRHLLDRNITEDSALIAGHIRVSLVKAEKKIPGAFFKAECKQEELAEMAARGVLFLRKADRKEIAARVQERMLPNMPPSLSGIDAISINDGCYTSATSDQQVDLFGATWISTVGQKLLAYSPAIAARLLCNVDVRELNPTSFSADIDDSIVEQDVGTEFLTWLWYFSEACGGVNGDFAFALDGPFTFVREGAGAHEIIIRKGNPGVSQEAKAALMAGKKLKKSKLMVVRGEEIWKCSINGSDWTFGSLKMPKLEVLGPVETFEARIILIDTFLEAIEDLFKRFMAIRVDESQWSTEVVKIKQWVSDRQSQA